MVSEEDCKEAAQLARQAHNEYQEHLGKRKDDAEQKGRKTLLGNAQGVCSRVPLIWISCMVDLTDAGTSSIAPVSSAIAHSPNVVSLLTAAGA